MNKRNMLKDADDRETSTRLSEREIRDDLKSEMMYFDGIWEYPDGEAPSREDIATVERVLKYASQCKYVGFTGADARLVMSCSTNVIKWALGHMECIDEGDNDERHE